MGYNQVMTDLLTENVTSDGQTFFDRNRMLQGQVKPSFDLQIFVVGATLSHSLLQCLTQFQNPFVRVDVKSFSMIHQDQPIAQIIPALQANLRNGIKTVLIGPNSTCCKTAFDALQFSEESFNVSLVQASAGIDLDKTFLDLRKPHLQNLLILGSQAHLSDQSFAGKVQVGYRNLRLGSLKPELGICEPEIRACDLFGLSLNALKYKDATIQSRVSATGFTAEDSCQMAYYAGRSECNQIFCMYDFDVSHDDRIGTHLLATLLWYYMHGLNLRRSDTYPAETSLQQYTLEHSIENKVLTFYKDESEQKWWLKSPYPKKKLSKNMPLLAIDYHDYQLAANEQMLSERVLGWFQLLEQSAELD
jgi:hypothetical protein